MTQSPVALRILAQHYRRTGERQKAISTMKAAVEQAPETQKSRYRLVFAEMLYRVDEFEAAAREYEKVPLQLDQSPESRRYLIALYNAGRLAKALEVARVVRGSKTAIPEFSEIEALILERSGDLASASGLREELLTSESAAIIKSQAGHGNSSGSIIRARFRVFSIFPLCLSR